MSVCLYVGSKVSMEKESLIFQGAESRTYMARFLGYPAVLKERFRKKYRIPEIDVILTKNRTRNEARCLAKAFKCGINVPRVFQARPETGELLMERIPGVSLERWFNVNPVNEGDMCDKVGTLLYKMHSSAKISHGDLTTSNLMVRDGEPVLIDFGLAGQQINDELMAVDLYGFERSIKCNHPRIYDEVFTRILGAYVAAGPQGPKVLHQLRIIQKRGRKRELE